MLIHSIAGVSTRGELREYVLKHGCYCLEENQRIYEKWFSTAPRYLFRAVDRKYGLSRKSLCDIGCAYGMNLMYCAPGSYGIEVEEYEVRFARSLGLTVYHRNILHDNLSDLPRVETVWCSAVLEHVDSPHILLRRLHLLLCPGGLLALYVPTLPLFPWLRYLPRIGRYFSGHTASDHVNAFTPSTVRFFCERAGFRTIETSPFYPGPFRLLNYFSIASRLIDGCIYVGRKIEGWEYPGKATRRVALDGNGYFFKGQEFPLEVPREP